MKVWKRVVSGRPAFRLFPRRSSPAHFPPSLTLSLYPTERNPSYKLHRRLVPTAATWLWLATCRHPAVTAGTVTGQADEFELHKWTELNFKVRILETARSWEMSSNNNNIMVRLFSFSYCVRGREWTWCLSLWKTFQSCANIHSQN